MFNHRSPDRARPQTARESESSTADLQQHQQPDSAEMTVTSLSLLKNRIGATIRSVLLRTWQCTSPRSGMPGAPAREKSASQSARADSAVCQGSPQSPRDFDRQSFGYRLRRACGSVWRELRRPPFEAGAPANPALRAPSRHKCPSPSVAAPCDACPAGGCARNGFRARLTAEEKATVREVFAHRLSENRK